MANTEAEAFVDRILQEGGIEKSALMKQIGSGIFRYLLGGRYWQGAARRLGLKGLARDFGKWNSPMAKIEANGFLGRMTGSKSTAANLMGLGVPLAAGAGLYGASKLAPEDSTLHNVLDYAKYIPLGPLGLPIMAAKGIGQYTQHVADKASKQTSDAIADQIGKTIREKGDTIAGYMPFGIGSNWIKGKADSYASQIGDTIKTQADAERKKTLDSGVMGLLSNL